jgi:hypothetical protein
MSSIYRFKQIRAVSKVMTMSSSLTFSSVSTNKQTLESVMIFYPGYGELEV